MLLLVLGLLLFVGAHSIRIVAENKRSEWISRIGPLGYKAACALVSVIGLLLIIKGYGEARAQPVALWPAWSAGRHIAALLSLIAFVLIAAAYVPGSRLRARLRHPMVLAVKLWAVGHLAANHTLADLVLFGSLLVWAVLSFRAARRRDRLVGAAIPERGALPTEAAQGPAEGALQVAPAPAGSVFSDLLALAIGGSAYWAFAFHLHASWIGVRPFG
jgi:uncharacterized membrane protein